MRKDRLIDSLLDIAPIFALVINEKAKILDLNIRASEEFGQVDKLIGTSFFKLFPSVERKRMEEFLSTGFTLRGRSPHEIFQGFPSDSKKSPRFFEMTTMPFERNDRKYLLVTFNNISKTISLLSQEEISRVKAETLAKALRETETKLEIALRAGKMGTWEYDIESRILKWSRGVIDPMHPQRTEPVDQFFERIYKVDTEKFKKILRKNVRDRLNFSLEYRIKAKDGRLVWVSSSGVLINGKGGKKIIGVWTDITSRKNAEMRVKIQYGLSRVLAKRSELSQVAPEVLKRVGEGFNWECGVLWRPDKERKMLVCFTTWHTKDANAKKIGLPAIGDEIEKGEGLAGQVWNKKDVIWAGEKYKFAVIGIPVIFGQEMLGIIVFYSQAYQFINEETVRLASTVGHQLGEFIHRTQTRGELARSKAELETILESVAEAIIVQNNKGDVVYANEEGVKFGRYAQLGDLKGTTFEEIKESVDFYDTKDHLVPSHKWPGSVAMKGKENSAVLRCHFRQSGEDVWIRAIAKPVFDGDRKVQLIVNIVQDITKQVYEERQRELFLSMTTHELRTPIASIKAYSRLGQKRTTRRDVKNFLGKIDDQASKLQIIINDFLDIAKIREGKLSIHKREFDFDELVDQVVSTLRTISTKHKIIKKGKVEKVINADPDRINQVLSNLITNAIKYSPETDKIIVETKVKEDYLLVKVQDFGIGVPKNQQRSIFKSFYQVPKRGSKEGLGLGLYISGAIIKEHGGKIWVESKLGKGSNFYFSLPLK